MSKIARTVRTPGGRRQTDPRPLSDEKAKDLKAGLVS